MCRARRGRASGVRLIGYLIHDKQDRYDAAGTNEKHGQDTEHE
jgi:hypothetical protein